MQQRLTYQHAYPGDVIVLVNIIAESTGQGGTVLDMGVMIYDMNNDSVQTMAIVR